MPSALVLVCSIIAGFLVVYVVLKIFSSSRDTRWQVIRKNGNKSAVVLVHGLSGRKKFESTIKLAEATLPDSDLLIFDYDSRVLSNESPYKIANVIERQIHEFYLEKKYSEIILVGYSMGGMLLRKALLWGNGIEDDRQGFGNRGKREWVTNVSRFISLASINRGWSISPRPKNMSAGVHLVYSFFEYPCRIRQGDRLTVCPMAGSTSSPAKQTLGNLQMRRLSHYDERESKIEYL